MAEVLRKVKKYLINRYRRRKFGNIGTNVIISKKNLFKNPKNIILGDNVFLGHENVFHGFGGIEIGNGTILAHNIEIQTRNHNYDSIDLKSVPYDNKVHLKSVKIEENVWIGSHVLIIPGVTIGEGAVIGMGAVVTRDVPPFAVMGGNPAQIIKYRDKNKYESLKLDNKIYLKLKYEDK